MISLEGTVHDNTIVVNNNISAYEGQKAIVTIMDSQESAPRRRKDIDLDSYGHRTERGQHVDEYMEEIRADREVW